MIADLIVSQDTAQYQFPCGAYIMVDCVHVLYVLMLVAIKDMDCMLSVNMAQPIVHGHAPEKRAYWEEKGAK